VYQASLKYENSTVSYHNYITILGQPQNILKLQIHFICTFYSINNLRFSKITVSWNGELPPHVPNFKMFLTLPKLHEVVSIGPNLI